MVASRSVISIRPTRNTSYHHHNFLHFTPLAPLAGEACQHQKKNKKKMASPRPTTTKQWILTNKPAGEPILSGPDATWQLKEVPLPPLEPGQILAKVKYFSNDTGLRNFIQSTVAADRFYVPTVPLGSPMRSGVIAEVVESASDKFKAGDMVMDFHLGVWGEHCILNADESQPLGPLPGGLSPTHYLGALGASGLAAYTGLYYAGKAKPGQTIVISAAAGATGTMAVQIAAKILGAGKVIGISSSEEKCKFVKSLGAHECLNYNSPTFKEDLIKATPDEVDLFFDNTGGEILDLMLTRVKKHGHVAVCGAVTMYNNEEPLKLKNWFEVISCRITIRGFIMLDYMDKVPAIMGELMGAIADGRLQLGDAETIIDASIEEQPKVWMRLFNGEDQQAKAGKLITRLN
ncbi:NADP-dependent leukotriene B4 12-hydroxydehydrogenase [Pyricularia oryzae 70-15]|uniref:Dehydrogenase FUB6 n=5 Tax=Pyricularia TaxID=48558 RepID=G4N6I5_PYRO7|nr:NADP-dependent leukotriene B4 12-hydroxydehydrogenase [Pyricularia oryzae 70-15]EHA49855.1 NADP-dependent leukotriene B4 12-hydroxydehydrogenase [Pyricularia oryzae 70-15]